MSQLLLQEARTIGQQLSATEKAQLIEWLSIQLRQELDATQRESSDLDTQDKIERGSNVHQHADLPTEEVPATWTDEEIRVLMKPDPKTGAEIVALLQTLDLSSWQEQDIPDVVEWLQDRRKTVDRRAIVAEQGILPAWTHKEIRAMMAPDPRTGKEIAALIESGEIDTSIGAEMEIDDVVTWLEDLRRQERIERGLEA